MSFTDIFMRVPYSQVSLPETLREDSTAAHQPWEQFLTWPAPGLALRPAAQDVCHQTTYRMKMNRNGGETGLGSHS